MKEFRKLMEASQEAVTISQVIQEHISRRIPLNNSLFRLGSEAYIEVFSEAKEMRERGELPELDEISEALLQTDIGEYGEYNGNLVPLDLPQLNEDPNESRIIHKQIWKENKDKYMSALIEFLNECVDQENVNENLVAVSQRHSVELLKEFVDYLVEEKKLPRKFSPTYKDLTEAEYQGRKVELNKPKRGGSKSYYVYVRNPDTGNVIKVEFGSGMPAKLDDPERRKAYDSRHGCSAGRHNDKTKPGYWSCRLPRYADALGLSGSGQWW